ncbi:MAG TPA: hypothetical protein VFJ82_12665 [Longimicrobium sp.]|nr:hypothetical protein [Longimicrobium sp.]
MRFRALAAPAALFAVFAAAAPLRAQNDRVYIYRYTVDADVPESAGMIAMDATPLRVLRASAPKPLMASVFGSLTDRRSGGGAAVDLSPYWLAGGGRRSLEGYRRMTLAGRLTRVLTKTVLSVAALQEGGDAGELRLGIGVRSTFHDPHDPIGPAFGLPERVELARRTGGPGAVDSVYAAVRREVRAQCCLQVTGGWGLELRAPQGEPGKLGNARHTVWLAGQFTLSERWDLLTTVRGRGLFDSGANLRTGAGLQYKTSAADLFAEVAFDTNDHRLHPGGGAEVRLARHVSAVAAVAREMDAGDSRARLRAVLRWYPTNP